MAYVASAATYLAVAVWMLVHGVIFPDSVSRVANAYYVLFSRDPHLPAVGFVWNPLPSLLLLPVLPLKGLLPVLTRDGLAGPIESALFMAGAVVLLLRLLRLLGNGFAVRCVLTVLFAADPMIVMYGGSGESEGMLLFFMLLTVNGLVGWLADREPGRLVGVGLALGGAYLTRYEAVAPAAAVVLVVTVLTLVRTAGPIRSKVLTAVNDALLVGLPFLLAFAVWALSSRVLVKQWFPTFSSSYGNSSQVGNERQFIQNATGTTLGSMIRYAAEQLSGLEPLVPVLLVLAAVVAFRRRQLTALAAPLVFGAVLAFDNLAFLSGTSFGWLRFQITVIPLAFALAGTILGRPPEGPRPAPRLAGALAGTFSAGGSRRTQPPWRRALGLWAPGTVVVAMVALSLPVTAETLTSHRLAREETSTALAAVDAGRSVSADRVHLLAFQTDHAVADSLDAMHLPAGSVLTDAAYSFDIVLATRDPRQFVITSDRDFVPILRDPGRHGVRYLLVPDPPSAPFDAVGRQYPGIYDDGAHIAHLVRSWRQLSFGSSWRLYRLDERTTPRPAPR